MLDNNEVVYGSLDESLDRLDHAKFKDFDCGEPFLNGFVSKKLLSENVNGGHKAIVARSNDRLVGYVTLSVNRFEKSEEASLLLSMLKKRKISVVMIEQIAATKDFKGFKVGTTLMAKALDAAVRISHDTGIIGVALWAHPDAVSFYERLGMNVYGNKTVFKMNLSLMFISIETVKDALQSSDVEIAS
jgi:GNAT superfamily N-acetyltransferase